ncbi:hypothetical protein BT69DRAFT_1282161 [Atractiella rhizophila]|nr:hypothetical protein BT69DRAFT_1282161 [Atractiella rhizophila]
MEFSISTLMRNRSWPDGLLLSLAYDHFLGSICSHSSFTYSVAHDCYSQTSKNDGQ